MSTASGVQPRRRQAMKGLFLPMLLLGSASPAFGEGGCPDGQFPSQNGPVMMCVPGSVPGASGSQQPVVWADRWGAISADGITGSLGVSVDMPSKRKAERAAMADCRAKGGKKCGVDISYYNQCAAMILGDHRYNTSRAATEEKAIALGMGTCEKEGDTNCRVYYSACSTPVRIR